MSEAPVVPVVRLNQGDEPAEAKPSMFFSLVKSICAPVPASAYVYSGYIATMLVAKALRNDPERLIEQKSVRIEKTGDARYAVSCVDENNVGYRVTVEVVR